MNYSVSVRALCEFGAKVGDLDHRFTPSPTAQDGIAGHAQVTARRPPGYRKELNLMGNYGLLQVRGRADGYDPTRHLLEEIKTHRGDLAAMPANQRQLHWAQAKVYGHLLCRQLDLASLDLALVYYDIDRQSETALPLTMTATELATFFASLCARFIAWAEQELAQRTARDTQLTTLPFAYPAFRLGQRALAEAVYKASVQRRCLLAQAPTGIGKTIGSLFPALKAVPGQGIDKIYFLTAKTPGRQLALDAMAQLKRTAPTIRVLELVAREKACEHPDKACHPDSCPLAKGFYDRLPAARQAAAGADLLDRASVRAIAATHQICPYYLASEMARWSDVIVADYNYYFDQGGMLYGLMLANQWRVTVLVDEAHNLVARARAMYSSALERTALRTAKAGAPAPVAKAVGRVLRHWPRADGEADYQVLSELPAALRASLTDASAAIGASLVDQAGAATPELLRTHFDLLHFLQLHESIGEHAIIDASGAPASTLCIRNMVPAPYLKARFTAAHASVLFSATLAPWHYYADALGLPADTVWIDVDSPFKPEQLSIRIAKHISTRYPHRGVSVGPIAELIARQFDERAGNYLAFFSSFDYLDQVATHLAQHYPHIPIWRQQRRMDDTARGEFLARFAPDGVGVGFAVLGGAFGEGIDLPGTRLIGAFIATLGLPQFNPVNEQCRLRMQALFGAGYDYAYLYPGIQKVVQAAGRVIRSETDRGTICLIDDRFAHADVQQLLPAWWRIGVNGSAT